MLALEPVPLEPMLSSIESGIFNTDALGLAKSMVTGGDTLAKNLASSSASSSEFHSSSFPFLDSPCRLGVPHPPASASRKIGDEKDDADDQSAKVY